MADFITYTENYLKENGLLNGNVDPAVITPVIILVQDMYLHPILGTDLFNDIKDEIIAGSVSGVNQTLLDDHIEKLMFWYVLCEVTPAIKYRYMNKNVLGKTGSDTSPADLNEVQWNMNHWKNRAEMYAERLTNYLIDHSDSYPLYSANTRTSDIKPNKTNFTSTIWLGDDDDDCCKDT